MYSSIETDVSWHYLKTLLKSIPQPHCLIGGWSVYLIVNDLYQKDTGREYQGSRDIDLGFHFDPEWDQKQFDNSTFARAVFKIREMGFESVAYRFLKRFRLSDGQELTTEQSRHLQPYDMFNLYIDVFVDSDDPKRIKMSKFPVAEELLLARVFSGHQHLTKKVDELEVMVPDPRVQMEMKIRSFPERTDDDKRRKDLLDLCALILYSGPKPPTTNGPAQPNYKLALKNVTEAEWKAISEDLNLTVIEAKRVANQVG
ncbi:hypothetical protein E6H18_05760 [Candidatus Bathyarchaeota archaeon]|nr:MAG: hypothetical protein E6H18_05760 [Candidatus Bathyarchaeota archaeon]